MNDKQFEDIMEEMVDFTAESISNEDESKKKIALKGTLSRIRDVLKSKSFNRKCKEKAKMYDVNDKLIKNAYALGILNKIGETTGLLIEVTGEAFNYLIRLISFVIQKVMDIAVSSVTSLVNILTCRKVVKGEII